MKVAVDAMGGDHGPGVIVQGAVEAAAELGVQVTLVGNEKRIMKAHSSRFPDFIDVYHCEEAIRMDEFPLKAVRKKKEASIRVAFDLVKKARAQAVVSAGNSGATLVAGVLGVGLVKGVERPGIASIFPSERGPVILIDVGASIDCRPNHLLQFGLMAQAFASSCLNIKKPKVGLLSIGEEGSKGNEQVLQARKLFELSPLNFVGNVEGGDVFTGNVDIIVCDGFVGNVALKVSEGMGQAMSKFLKSELRRGLSGRMGFFLARKGLEQFEKRVAYEEYGGAPLLGINGVGIVCHGASSPRAIKNAIGLATRYVENRVLEKMALELTSMTGERAA